MKKQNLILIILFAFILYACNNCPTNKDILETWNNGSSKKEIKWTDKKDSTYIETTFFENGQKNLERIVVNVQLEKLTGYYETGEFAGYHVYFNNIIIAAVEFYKNGQKKGDVIRGLDGKSYGKIRYYYENGQVREEGNSLSDKREGIWKKYDEKGNLVLERVFENGKQIDSENN